MPVNEDGLEQLIRKRIMREYPDCWLIKTVGGRFQVPGLPDFIGCFDGLTLGIEVKFQHADETYEHARNRTTPAQQAQIDGINRAGGMAGVALTVEESLDLIKRGLARRASEPVSLDDLLVRDQDRIVREVMRFLLARGYHIETPHGESVGLNRDKAAPIER